MTADDLNSIAWAAFMKFALGEPQMRAAFEAESGREYNVGLAASSTKIEVIPQGGEIRLGNLYVMQFIEWATRNHWGIEFAPAKYREQLLAKEAAQS